MFGDPVVAIRPPLRQILPQLVVGVIAMIVAASIQQGALVAIALLGMGYVVLVWRQSGTMLTEAELIVLGLRNRAIPWSDIEDVREQPGPGSRAVVVEEHSGRLTVLATPRTSRLAPDPDYEARRDRVFAAWHESTRRRHQQPPEPAT